VIFDDISLEPGKIRFRETGSAWGQNWVKSIISHIGEDFKRIKIGIGQDKTWDLSDWVLSKFSSEELENLEKEIFPKASDILFEKL
jgi:PTH1 family peptidyl-tRNA hydrolase